MSINKRPSWQLPPGVSPGTWDYVQSDHIAEDYDEFFAASPLFNMDESIVRGVVQEKDWVIDLGSGTGRSILPLARRGFPCVALDLSLPMLRVTAEKARQEGLNVHCIAANMVELDAIADCSFRYALCLFSTLGMIRGRENREAAISHIFRILKPGGALVLHVHNFWHSLTDAAGRMRIMKHLLTLPFRRADERGDRYYPYRGLPNMFLHTFSRRELVRLVRGAGFRIERFIPLQTGGGGELSRPWLFGGIRANGWVVIARRGETS